MVVSGLGSTGAIVFLAWKILERQFKQMDKITSDNESAHNKQEKMLHINRSGISACTFAHRLQSARTAIGIRSGAASRRTTIWAACGLR